jgi:hypothetical protein
MNRSVLVLLAPLLVGCNVHANNPANDNGTVTINADDSGQVEFNLPFVSGNVKLPEGMMQNGDFDIDGVKMVPGGQITGVKVNAADKGSTVDIAFSAPTSPDQVRAYFLDQFKQKGAAVAQTGDAVSGKTRDGDAFTINVGPAPQGSQGKITIQDKDE